LHGSPNEEIGLAVTGIATTKPTGTVTFLNGTTVLGTGTLSNSATDTLTISTLPVGAESIKASYGGDSNYAAATSTATTVTVNKATQTVIFPAPATPVTYGVGPITLTATASSGLAVAYTATGPATAKGSTLTITGAGTVTVTANQAGNSNYSAATPVSHSITVNKAT
jgi:hypothetical protein